MFRFASSTWLTGLLLMPALLGLFWYGARARRRALAEFADSELVVKLTASVSAPARRVKAALQVAAVGLVVLALARPQFGTRVETVRRSGRDIMVAIDLSESMLAEDVAPSRLERARLAVLRLMDALDGDRIGLVAFAADAFVQSPLTVDYRAAALFLGAMHPDIVPVQGTDLGAALRVSLDALEQGARDEGVVVVVTDTEDHEGGVEEQLARAQRAGVQVYMVAIGTEEGGPIPTYDEQGRRTGFLRDEGGSVVTTRLDPEMVRRFETTPGVHFARAGAGGTGFDDLVREIAGGEGSAVEERQVTQFEEQFQIFLGLALALLLLDAVLSERRKTEEAWLGRFEG